MSFEELRSLVVELVEPEHEPEHEHEPGDDPVNEFDTQLTTFHPSKPRTSTLDDLIKWLRTSPPPLKETARPKTRRRA